MERHKFSLLFLAIFLAGTILAYIGTFFFEEGFNYLYIVPHNKGITAETFLQAGVDWIWDTFFFSLKAFNVFLITKVLMPMKNAFLGMPVLATFVLVMGTGYIIGGVKSAIIVGGFLLFISLSSLPNFCLAIPEILSASFTLSAEKNTESFSFNLQIFTNSLIAFSEKNFPIGPFPINLALFFSNII